MSLLESLKAHCTAEHYPMHMPGHKRNVKLLEDYKIDITEIDGFDNLHHPSGILRDSMEEAAAIYGTKNSIYVTNGSTAAILASLHAAAKKSDTILVARNCHMSVYNAVSIRNLKPIYVYPKAGRIEAEEVAAAISENPDITAFVVTSPSYEGYFSNISEISKVCHEHAVTLIVDEAHGAHLPFAGLVDKNYRNRGDVGKEIDARTKNSEEVSIESENLVANGNDDSCMYKDFFGISALYQGADLVIQSLHKTLPAMTQTAILHRNSDRVSYRSLLKALDIYETSSPSYVMMSSIEECIHYMVKNCKELFEGYKKLLEDIYIFADGLKKGLLVPFVDEAAGKTVRDPGKILIDGKKLSMTGKQIYDILRGDYGLVAEMYEGSICLLLTSVCDTKEGFERLKNALRALADNCKKQCDRRDKQVDSHHKQELSCELQMMAETGNFKDDKLLTFPRPRVSLYPSQTEDMKEALISLEELNRIKAPVIAAETIIAYPPGIPIVVAGELIDAEVLDFIQQELKAGAEVYGVYDKGIYILI